MLVVDEAYKEGLGDIEPGQRIVTIFNFHESPAFSPDLLRQMPPHRRQGPPGVDSSMGIFSICSSVRPSPIGVSVLEVPEVEGNVVRVRGLYKRDGIPILDFKPYLVETAATSKGEEGAPGSLSWRAVPAAEVVESTASTKAVGLQPSAILTVRRPYGDRRVNTVISGRQLKRKRG